MKQFARANLLVLFAALAGAQTFDVASIRVSQLGRTGGEGSRREGIEHTPGSLIMRNVRMTTLIRWAYDVKDYQVNGPGWIGSERYDLSAKAAGAADDDAMRLMLQALLADRFKLAIHREKKEMQAYVLTVGKNGPKFKPSEGDPEMKLQPTGRFGARATGVTVQQFCDMISQPLNAPVIDQTGLKGKYDASIDFSAYVPQDPKEIIGPADVAALALTAIQDLFGLKLESKKLPIDLIVVDRAEKTPTEN